MRTDAPVTWTTGGAGCDRSDHQSVSEIARVTWCPHGKTRGQSKVLPGGKLEFRHRTRFLNDVHINWESAPIAAAGLMRRSPSFRLRGEAGARQVPGTPERGVAQAWGDLMQVGTVVVMGTDARPGGVANLASQGQSREPAELDARTDGALATPSSGRPSGPSMTGSTPSGTGMRARPSGRSWRVCAKDSIVATFCSSCERTLVPPRKFCERCFRPTDGWTEVLGSGRVETFSICHVTWDMRPLDPPEVPAAIRLDGASSGGFLHKLGEVEPADVSIGMAVEAVFLPASDRTGSILDIAYFRPRGS